MEIYLLILLCCIISIIILSIILNKRNKTLEAVILKKHEIEVARKEELKEYFNEEWEKEKERIDKDIKIYEGNVNNRKQELENQYKLDASKYSADIDKLKVQLTEKEKRYEEVNQDLDLYREGKMKEIDGTAAEYEQRKRTEIEQILKQAELNANSNFNNQVDSYLARRSQMECELEEIRKELEEERNKRAAVNEELRKAEEKEKYNEIHSVQLTDNEKEDIHFLLSLEDRLHNKQALYKLVWSTYLQQAYKNTFHNILGNRDPRNVIYCIENIETGKKYIGKTSAEVSKRWTEHIKTSLNIGSIKSTNIHKALYNHWDEFIFYILVETEKEKLSEMEKYYINFYESDKYGYNIKAGG